MRVQWLFCRNMWSTLRYPASFVISRTLVQVRCRSTVALGNDSEFVLELAKIVGSDNVCLTEAVRKQFSVDEGLHSGRLPDVVVKPSTTDQVSRISNLCLRNKTPIIPYGTGTGLEGGVIPIEGGVTISLLGMNRVLAVNANDLDVTVEAGVTRKELNVYLRDTGLWFPIDPGADASIGGMAATSASGTNAVRYGTMRENVLNLEVVLPDGTIVHSAGKGSRSRKTSAGYNLTNLFVGSEGTLGTITAVTLRLHALPETISAAVCTFPHVENAVSVAIQILQSNVDIARVELLDSLGIKAINAYSKCSLAESPTLFMEFHGQPVEVKEQQKIVTEIVDANDGTDLAWANELEDRNRLWHARHQLYYAFLALRPGCTAVVTDVCVPISKLPELVSKTAKDIEESGIIGSCLGHVGDGNFHTLMMCDANNNEELAIIKGINERLVHHAWAVNGTCTAEHGIGMGKVYLLEGEIGKGGMSVMRQIKKTLDPLNIMNPGKVLKVF